MFIAALMTKKQPKCLLNDEWIKKEPHMCIMANYSVINTLNSVTMLNKTSHGNQEKCSHSYVKSKNVGFTKFKER